MESYLTRSSNNNSSMQHHFLFSMKVGGFYKLFIDLLFFTLCINKLFKSQGRDPLILLCVRFYYTNKLCKLFRRIKFHGLKFNK